jgi:hypothetical protein
VKIASPSLFLKSFLILITSNPPDAIIIVEVTVQGVQIKFTCAHFSIIWGWNEEKCGTKKVRII